MGIHRKRKFVAQLKGTYVDYENFFKVLMSRLNMTSARGFRTLGAQVLASEFEKYVQYLDTDTDVDWKEVCFELLHATAERDLSWFEGLWCSTGRFDSADPIIDTAITLDEYPKIIQQFVEWMEQKIHREKIFLPTWYKRKLFYWGTNGFITVGDIK